jgi:hypothetical protein
MNCLTNGLALVLDASKDADALMMGSSDRCTGSHALPPTNAAFEPGPPFHAMSPSSEVENAGHLIRREGHAPYVKEAG